MVMGDHGTRDGFVKTEEIANWITEDALDYVRGGGIGCTAGGALAGREQAPSCTNRIAAKHVCVHAGG